MNAKNSPSTASTRITKSALYGIDAKLGCLSHSASSVEVGNRLPYYLPLVEAALALPKLLAAGCIRDILKNMPLRTMPDTVQENQLRPIMRMLSFLAHADVYGGPEPKPWITQKIALPLYEAAMRIGRPPVLSYASYALDNWYCIDPQKQICLGNIALHQNFLGGMDEDWFILVHVDIEHKAAAIYRAIPRLQLAVINNNSSFMAAGMAAIERTTQQMYDTLSRMPERCDPYIYYTRVRPYIHGWGDTAALPNGVLYEGVEAYQNKPQKFRGETGAQSSILPTLYALLGIEFSQDAFWRYLMEMRTYMPPRHRAYIEAVACGPSIRGRLMQQNVPQNLKIFYNACVERLAEFLTLHLSYAHAYIGNQQQKKSANPTSVGTGGTPFQIYLNEHIDTVLAHRL